MDISSLLNCIQPLFRMGKLVYICLLLCFVTIATCKKKDEEVEKQSPYDVQSPFDMQSPSDGQSPYDVQYPYFNRFVPSYYKDPSYWKYTYNPFFAASANPMYQPPANPMYQPPANPMYQPPANPMYQPPYYGEPQYYVSPFLKDPTPWKTWFDWKSKFWNPMAPRVGSGYNPNEY